MEAQEQKFSGGATQSTSGTLTAKYDANKKA